MLSPCSCSILLFRSATLHDRIRSSFSTGASHRGRAGALPLQFLPPRIGGGQHGGGFSHMPTRIRAALCCFAAPKPLVFQQDKPASSHRGLAHNA